MLHRHSLLIAILICASCASEPARAPLEAADLSHVPITSADGATTNLATIAAGRAVVVSLWAPWCEGCRTEEPALLRLHQLAIARHDFVLVSIAIGTSASEVSTPTPYARLFDTGAFAEVGKRRVPATLVIDATGHTVYEGGALDADALAALTKTLAHERSN
jgi:thiol-disulfide isomerase/thioredoxin